MWVLLLIVHVGYGTAMTQVTMKDQHSCIMARDTARNGSGFSDAWAGGHESAYCLNTETGEIN